MLHTHAEGILASAASADGGWCSSNDDETLDDAGPPTFASGRRLSLEDDRHAGRVEEHAHLDRGLGRCVHLTTLLDIDDIMTLLQNEEYLTARDCLKYGFIDEIL